MAHTTFSRPAPFGAITIYRASIAIQDAVTGLVAWNASRRTRKVLSKLSNEVLADIGLDRNGIAKI